MENKNNQKNSSSVDKEPVRSVTTGEIIPGLHIDAPVVSSIGSSALKKELLTALGSNEGSELRAALNPVDPTGWERPAEARQATKPVTEYTPTTGNSEVTSDNVLVAAGAGISQEQHDRLNALNQPTVKNINPNGWEQK